MKERPIIFGAESVKAILDGRKTQTRRVVKCSTDALLEGYARDSGCAYFTYPSGNRGYHRCPHGMIGDRLWVRESAAFADPRAVIYRADLSEADAALWKFKSPIFTPRWASRITLEITDVRVDPLQEITDEDATAEGVCEEGDGCQFIAFHRDMYIKAWDALNAERGFPFASNPWVWVITFKRINS